MNDRYLFRGKRVDNGEWVEGYLSHADIIRPIGDGFSIQTIGMSTECNSCGVGLRVAQTTVSMSTGLRDRDGTLIFESDIVEINKTKSRAKIVWGEARGNREPGHNDAWILDWKTEKAKNEYRNDLGFWAHRVKVVGSIHDTTRLHGVVEKDHET